MPPVIGRTQLPGTPALQTILLSLVPFVRQRILFSRRLEADRLHPWWTLDPWKL